VTPRGLPSRPGSWQPGVPPTWVLSPTRAPRLGCGPPDACPSLGRGHRRTSLALGVDKPTRVPSAVGYAPPPGASRAPAGVGEGARSHLGGLHGGPPGRAAQPRSPLGPRGVKAASLDPGRGGGVG
jgi:hypothetical protein